MSEYANRFGRRGGRGIRPWLLVPKVIAVCIYIGSLASATAIWLASDFPALAPNDPHRLWVMNLVGRLVMYLVVPALLAAMAFGVALFLQHPRQFIRMRWLIVKLISLAILIPSAHAACSSRLAILRRAFEQSTADDAAAWQLAAGLLITLAASIWIVILGRLKPRLGQNWARTFKAMAEK